MCIVHVSGDIRPVRLPHHQTESGQPKDIRVNMMKFSVSSSCTMVFKIFC